MKLLHNTLCSNTVFWYKNLFFIISQKNVMTGLKWWICSLIQTDKLKLEKNAKYVKKY